MAYRNRTKDGYNVDVNELLFKFMIPINNNMLLHYITNVMSNNAIQLNDSKM